MRDQRPGPYRGGLRRAAKQVPGARPLVRWLRTLTARPTIAPSPSASEQAPRAAAPRHGGGPDDPRFKPDAPPAVLDAWQYLRGERVRSRHAETVARVRARLADGAPLRIAFVVNERSKWSAGHLLTAFAARGWDVSVALYRMERTGETLEQARQDHDDERAVFSALPATFIDTYDWESMTHRPVESLDADVVFLQQPWRMETFPERLVGRALPAYVPYSVPLFDNMNMHDHIPGFHAYLWRRYVPTDPHRDLHLEADVFGYDRLRVVGYPKLDGYRGRSPSPADVTAWQHPGKPSARVIVAPHHSVGATGIGLATFPWSHQALLDLADSYPNVAWLYKPHQRLRYALEQARVMSGERYDEYEAQWRRRANCAIYDGPHYLDLFRTSDALITDSGSFLAEYLPSGEPILRLTSDRGIGFNPVGERLRESFYEVNTVARLQETFRQVVIDGEDPLAEVRSRHAALFQPGARTSSERIADDLEASLTAAAD